MAFWVGVVAVLLITAWWAVLDVRADRRHAERMNRARACFDAMEPTAMNAEAVQTWIDHRRGLR